jgi:chaperonin GroEL
MTRRTTKKARKRFAPALYRKRTGGSIRLAPQALGDLATGFDQLAALMSVTLGPSQGPILNARSQGSVELLSDAGTIARRIVEVPDRGRNTGAMIARHLAWRMHGLYGDGAATAVVLARQMVREAVKRIAAGVEPVSISRGLEQALATALEVLAAASTPACGLDVLTGTASGITGDPELGAVLGEIVDLLGAEATVTIEEFPVPYLDREYIEGATWRAHPAARAMIPEGHDEIVLDNPLILLADQRLAEVGDVLPALELAAQSPGRRPLLVVSAKIGDHALSTLTINHAQGKVTAVAALPSASGAALTDALGDLATLTGGALVGDALGLPPARLRPADLGSAHKVALSRDRLTLVGGAGDPASVQDRSSLLRRRMANVSPGSEEWKRLRDRAAQLNGRGVILKVGAHSETERTRQRAQAEKALLVLTGMLADGVLPGGGVAYLECVPAVCRLREESATAGYGHGIDVFLSALEAPFKQLIRNDGRVHPLVALAEARRLGGGFGFDVRTGHHVDVRQQGILESARVAQGALALATSTAISVITTGAIVLPASSRRPLRVQP